MGDSHPKFNKTLRIIISPWTLIIAVFLLYTWTLTEGFFGLSKNWIFVINFSLSLLTLFILWRILRKQKREAKAISMKIAELTRYIKGTKHERFGQNGNGFKPSELNLHR